MISLSSCTLKVAFFPEEDPSCYLGEGVAVIYSLHTTGARLTRCVSEWLSLGSWQLLPPLLKRQSSLYFSPTFKRHFLHAYVWKKHCLFVLQSYFNGLMYTRKNATLYYCISHLMGMHQSELFHFFPCKWYVYMSTVVLPVSGAVCILIIMCFFVFNDPVYSD